MQKLGMPAGNDVFNTSNLHAMSNCVQRPINVVRLVMRLAIMYVAAKRHPSLTCGGLGNLEIMHISDLHTLGRILIKSHQGTNFVPFGYLEAKCRELDVLRAHVLKVVANEHLVCDLGDSHVARDTGWEGVMLWPSIPNCCFLAYRTHVDHEILRNTNVRLTALDIWDTANVFCHYYSDFDLFQEIVMFLLVMSWWREDKRLDCPSLGGRWSYALPDAKMSALAFRAAMAPPVEPP